MNTTEHSKLRLSLRAQLTGMALLDDRYEAVLRAFAFAERYHVGTRRCGVIPSFNHQMNILGMAMSQHKNLAEPWNVYMAILTHDTVEDYPQHSRLMEEEVPEAYPFARRMSKIRDGEKVDPDEIMDEQANCIVCSVAKPLDRIHNLSTMLDVFKVEKIEEYIEETESHILPMIKKAKIRFPLQNAIYESMKSLINIQLKMAKQYVAATQAQPA